MVSLEKTYYVTQIVAVIALIVSLLYVGRNIEQNTIAIGNISLQGSADTWNDRAALIAQDAELADILRRGDEDYGSLDATEQYRAQAYASMAVVQVYNEYLDEQSGAHGPGVWDVLIPWMGLLMESPAARQFYLGNPQLFDEGFRNFVDSLIQEVSAS